MTLSPPLDGSPQRWVRDSPGPVLSLGDPGAFDDAHLFAPCVTFDSARARYRMWYCGSRGAVNARVFRLGHATSNDGVRFTRSPAPVFEMPEPTLSILTPAMLTQPDGTLSMWFSCADLTKRADPLHTLRRITTADGMRWSAPSPPLLDNVYSPTIVRELDGTYRMWYVDPSRRPWVCRHASSADGLRWVVRDEPVLRPDQSWEIDAIFYPTVLKLDANAYAMWYGSYWANHGGSDLKTALGFATSTDGIRWTKSPHNPVYTPDASRSFESHFTTSQSILRLPDGTLRMWYASRPKPPFDHKYFAICTARLC
jgi:hypothetical protein